MEKQTSARSHPQVSSSRASTMPSTRDAAVTPALTIWEEKPFHGTVSVVLRVLTATEKPI